MIDLNISNIVSFIDEFLLKWIEVLSSFYYDSNRLIFFRPVVSTKHKNRNIVLALIFILLLTKLLGFVKLRIMAQLFGASRELDIFWAASTIPDMVFNVLMGGSINAAIIPVLSGTLHTKGKAELNKMFDHLVVIFFALFSIISVTLFIFTPQLGESLATSNTFRGFLDISDIGRENLDLFVHLMRISLVSPIILGVSGLITAYLQNYKKFAITSLAPLFYNLAMIIGSVILVKYFDMGVEGLAISTLIGAVIHLAIQIPLWRKLYKEDDIRNRVTIISIFKDSGVLKTIKLSIPRILGLLGEQVNTFVNTLISFTLSAGALSAYKFAYSLHLFPANIIGSAIAQVSLPELSEQGCKGDDEGFRKTFNEGIQFSAYLILPIIALFVILRLPIVRLSYGTGAFDWQDTLLTAWCLALFGMSILGQTIYSIILRAFYALQETWIPLVATIIGVIVNLAVSYYFTNFFSHYYDWRIIWYQIVHQVGNADVGQVLSVVESFFRDFGVWCTTRGDSSLAVGGLALGMSVAYFFEMVIGFILLGKIKENLVTWKETIQPLILKVINTIIMGAGMYFVFKLFDLQLDTTRTVQVIILSICVTVYGCLSYLIGSKVFGMSEFESVISVARDFVNKVRRR